MERFWTKERVMELINSDEYGTDYNNSIPAKSAVRRNGWSDEVDEIFRKKSQGRWAKIGEMMKTHDEQLRSQGADKIKTEFLSLISHRIDKLTEDLAYYNKPMKISGTFTPEAHAYYTSIPTRLSELQTVLTILSIL